LLLSDGILYDEPVTRAISFASARPRGENPMHEHGPNELAGPLRGTAGWWQALGASPTLTEEATPTPDQPRKKIKSAKPIRTELVARVKKEIAAGTYDTPEKWEAALDCLFDRLDRGG
jgi:hypothetical protein